MGRVLPELWILRHGQTAWNVEGRLQGHLDSELTDTGLKQAEAQSRILQRVLPPDVRVIASTSGRARLTAEVAVQHLGFSIEEDADLREIFIGDWQGRLIEEVRALVSTDAADDPHLWKFDAPGGERLNEMADRARRVLDRLTGPTVLVTHGLTSRLLRCHVLNRPVNELSLLPGGQGVVHHLRDGVARVLSA